MVEVGKFTEEQLQSLVEDIETRWSKFREKVARRRAHFFHDESEDPLKGNEQWRDAIRYQTDIPRRFHARLKPRLAENHFMVRVQPMKDTATQRANANSLEEIFNSGFSFIEERERMSIQGYLADGQIIDGLSWLHWRMADHIWPEVPDYHETNEVVECEMCDGTGKVKGKKCGDCMGTGNADGMEYEPKEEGGYRETDESLQLRRKRDVARAGFPWYIEVPPASAVAIAEDKSLANGAAVVVLRRTVPRLSYIEQLQSEIKKRQQNGTYQSMSVNEANPAIPIYGEIDGPGIDSPSWMDYKNTMQVVEVWTRDEFYELVDFNSNQFGDNWRSLKLVKVFKHPYGQPPFALCSAVEVNDPDPERRFLPVLEGVFRLKADYDRIMALLFIIAEQIALPYYYWRKTGTGEPMLEEGDQKVVTFQRNSAQAEMAPEGYDLVPVRFELNPAFIQSVSHIRREMEEAIPSTGTAEISASTQPWTVRLQQSQESVEPKALVLAQAKAINTAARNMAQVMSLPAEAGGFGEPVVVFSRTQNGMLDTKNIVSIAPEEITSLDVSVDIKTESSAERITLVQHGMQLLNDPKVMLSMAEFVEEYEGKVNPDDVIAKRIADRIWFDQVLPQFSKQLVGKIFGTKFVMGPNGEFIGPGGQSASPMDVLAANGIQLPPENPIMPQGMAPAGPPMPPGVGPVGSPMAGMSAAIGGAPPLAPSMPSMPGLQGPAGAIPLPGMSG